MTNTYLEFDGSNKREDTNCQYVLQAFRKVPDEHYRSKLPSLIQYTRYVSSKGITFDEDHHRIFKDILLLRTSVLAFVSIQLSSYLLVKLL